MLSGVVVILIVLLIAVPVFMIVVMAGGLLGDTGFDMMEGIGGSWWVIVMPVFGLLAIALVLLLILGRPQGGPLPPVPYPPFPAVQEKPLAILDRRLASGEITLDEYLKVREHLDRK